MTNLKYKIGDIFKCGTKITESGYCKIVATDPTPPHPSGQIVSWNYLANDPKQIDFPGSFTVTEEELDKWEKVNI